jgi:sigma-E factor negative regulatory protein RseB
MKIENVLTSLLVVGVLLPSAPAYADEALDLLQKMRAALQTASYSGTVVYAQGTDLATYQISHTLQNGAEKGNVTRLSQGEGKPTSEMESFSLAKFQQVQPNMQKAYSLDLGGEDTIAGRQCQIVVARPRDRMRYLQRYCIDKANGMMLKYSMIDQHHDTVEQLVFTDIKLDTPDSNASTKATAALTPVALKTLSDSPSPNLDKAQNRWKFKSLPDGFEQVEQLEKAPKAGKAAVQHIILSDGVTSVSVFITKDDDTKVGQAYNSGAMNIFTSKINDFNITLVGEVPVRTLKQISEGMQYEQ